MVVTERRTDISERVIYTYHRHAKHFEIQEESGPGSTILSVPYMYTDLLKDAPLKWQVTGENALHVLLAEHGARSADFKQVFAVFIHREDLSGWEKYLKNKGAKKEDSQCQLILMPDKSLEIPEDEYFHEHTVGFTQLTNDIVRYSNEFFKENKDFFREHARKLFDIVTAQLQRKDSSKQ